MALRLASTLRLRTLDLMQIASALKIKLYCNIELEYFCTNDQTILDRANEIHQKTKILPIHAQDLQRILKI